MEPHNATNKWQGSFRVGYLDLVALKYGARIVGGIDEVALTWVDKHTAQYAKACVGYQYNGGDATDLPDWFAVTQVIALR